MKKSLCIILVFVIVLSMFTVIPASAEVVVKDYESFDPGYSTERYYVKDITGFEGMATMTAQTESTDTTIGNYVRCAWGSDTAKYPSYFLNMPTKSQPTLAADDKMEIEFDVRAAGYSETDFQIRLSGATYTYVVNFKKDGKSVTRTATSTSSYAKAIGTMPTGWAHTNFADWTRLKFVFEHTKYVENTDDTTEYEGKKLIALYVNGQPVTLAENADTSNVAYENGCIWGAMNGSNVYQGTSDLGYKGFYFGAKMTNTNTIDVDNISITTYTASDAAPVDKGALVTAIRRVQKSYDTQYAESGSDASQAEYFADFKASIDEAIELYQSTDVTQSAMDEAITAMEVYTIVATEPVWIWNDDLNTDTTGTYLKAEGSPIVAHDTVTFADDVTQQGVMKVSKDTGNYPRMAAQFDAADKRIAVDGTAASTHGKNAFAEFEYDLNISELWTGKDYVSFVTYLFDTTSKGLRPFSLEVLPNGNVVYGHHDSAPAEVTVGPSGVFDHTRTNRIKLVVQLTDAEGNATQLVDGIYLNGQKLNEEPIAFTNINPGGDTEANYITRLGFYVNSMKNTTGSYYIDNVRICTYNKKRATDPSHVEDNMELVEIIRNKYIEQEMVQQSVNRYSQEVQDRLAASVAALETYYTDGTGDKAALFAEAEEVTAALKAANIVTVYDGDPGTAAAGDGTYGITSTVTELRDSALATFDKIPLDASYGENTYAITEFEVKTEDFLNNDTKLTVDLEGNNTKFATVTLQGGAHPFISLNDGETDIWYGALEDGAWTTIRLRTQITDDDAAVVNENTAFYINGNDVMLRTPEDSGKAFKATATQYDGLSFTVSGGGKAYVDNVRVIKYYGAENEPVNFGQLLTAIRKGDAKLADAVVGTNVTEEIKGAYQEAQTTAKAVVEASPVPIQDTVNKANDTICQAYAKFLFADEATEIGTISFENADGSDAAYVTDGGAVTGVSVIKKAEYSYDGIVLVTVYNAKGVLIGCGVKDGVLEGAEPGTIQVTLDNPITLPADTEGVTVKAVIWEDGTAMRPIAEAHTAEQAEATIYVAGDSIVQTYNQEYWYPRDGWGAYVDDYYTANISQNNLAISGYTLRSYIEKGKMQIVEETMQEGDFFFVSFMANDSSSNGPKYVELLDYKNLLRHYGEVAAKHGAQVVYVTSPPVLSQVVDSENCYGNGAYPEAMREVAAELGAPLVDVYKMRKDLQREKGYDYVESAMYMCNEDAIVNNFGASSLAPDFIKQYYGADTIEEGTFSASDKTHISVWGAKWCASKIAESLQSSNCSLRYSVNSDSFYSFPNVWTATAQ